MPSHLASTTRQLMPVEKMGRLSASRYPDSESGFFGFHPGAGLMAHSDRPTSPHYPRNAARRCARAATRHRRPTGEADRPCTFRSAHAGVSHPSRKYTGGRQRSSRGGRWQHAYHRRRARERERARRARAPRPRADRAHRSSRPARRAARPRQVLLDAAGDHRGHRPSRRLAAGGRDSAPSTSRAPTTSSTGTCRRGERRTSGSRESARPRRRSRAATRERRAPTPSAARRSCACRPTSS